MAELTYTPKVNKTHVVGRKDPKPSPQRRASDFRGLKKQAGVGQGVEIRRVKSAEKKPVVERLSEAGKKAEEKRKRLEDRLKTTDELTGEPLFQPKVNKNAKGEVFSPKRRWWTSPTKAEGGTGHGPGNTSYATTGKNDHFALYQEANERKKRAEARRRLVEEAIAKDANFDVVRSNMRSAELVKKRRIRHLKEAYGLFRGTQLEVEAEAIDGVVLPVGSMVEFAHMHLASRHMIAMRFLKIRWQSIAGHEEADIEMVASLVAQVVWQDLVRETIAHQQEEGGAGSPNASLLDNNPLKVPMNVWLEFALPRTPGGPELYSLTPMNKGVSIRGAPFSPPTPDGLGVEGVSMIGDANVGGSNRTDFGTTGRQNLAYTSIDGPQSDEDEAPSGQPSNIMHLHDFEQKFGEHGTLSEDETTEGGNSPMRTMRKGLADNGGSGALGSIGSIVSVATPLTPGAFVGAEAGTGAGDLSPSPLQRAVSPGGRSLSPSRDGPMRGVGDRRVSQKGNFMRFNSDASGHAIEPVHADGRRVDVYLKHSYANSRPDGADDASPSINIEDISALLKHIHAANDRANSAVPHQDNPEDTRSVLELFRTTQHVAIKFILLHKISSGSTGGIRPRDFQLTPQPTLP